MASRSCRAGRAVPIEDWPSVVVQGLTVLNQNNWFPAMTLMVGTRKPMRTAGRLDLIYGLTRGLLPFSSSISRPSTTRAWAAEGRHRGGDLTPIQWQLIAKCWKMNLRPGQQSWWAPTVWRLGALGLWAWRLRKLNGPGFTWPLFMFANAVPEALMARMGKIHVGRPMKIKSRKELLATIKPHLWQHLPADAGDLPDGYRPERADRFLRLASGAARH